MIPGFSTTILPPTKDQRFSTSPSKNRITATRTKIKIIKIRLTRLDFFSSLSYSSLSKNPAAISSGVPNAAQSASYVISFSAKLSLICDLNSCANTFLIDHEQPVRAAETCAR